jgi:hypothetical protein
MGVMRTRSTPGDQKLLAEALAPPDLGDGIQSLGYWRSRRRRLPWYRVHARREAERMIVRWEQRVGAALVAQRAAAPRLRVSGGLLLAQSRLGRWARRARVTLTVALVLTAAFVAATAAAALAFLIHAL